jgi:hypothetical protein
MVIHHVAVGLDDVRERAGAVDNGTELSELDEALQVLDRLPVDLREGEQHPSPT